MRQFVESSLLQFSGLSDGLVRFHEVLQLACNVYIAPQDTCTQMLACLQCQYSVHRCHHTERLHIPWPGPRYNLSCNCDLLGSCTKKTLTKPSNSEIPHTLKCATITNTNDHELEIY